jgi:hypothetical protein
MTEAINLTGWEKCKSCGERTRQEDSVLCRPCDQTRILAEERERCARVCEESARLYQRSIDKAGYSQNYLLPRWVHPRDEAWRLAAKIRGEETKNESV